MQTIAATFDLTPREMSVLVAFVDVGAPAEIAARMGLTVHTVRTHIKSIYAKTGVSRQAELIKLVADFFSPVADGST